METVTRLIACKATITLTTLDQLLDTILIIPKLIIIHHYISFQISDVAIGISHKLQKVAKISFQTNEFPFEYKPNATVFS